MADLRPASSGPSAAPPLRERQASASVAFPEYDRPGRFVPQDPVADAEFLRKVRQRPEEQRRLGEIERRHRKGQNGTAS